LLIHCMTCIERKYVKAKYNLKQQNRNPIYLTTNNYNNYILNPAKVNNTEHKKSITQYQKCITLSSSTLTKG